MRERRYIEGEKYLVEHHKELGMRRFPGLDSLVASR